MPKTASLVDLLHYRAAHQPDMEAYVFLEDENTKKHTLTYKEFDQRARAIGAWLQMTGAAGQRVLLLCHSGLEYIEAFFGCLYAKAIAVPAYPPRPNRTLERLQAILTDAEPMLILASRSVASGIKRLTDQEANFKPVKCQTTDAIGNHLADMWQDPAAEGDTVAFLQYTSGSTSRPKGVIITHRNLLYNERAIRQAFQQSEESIIVGWLPLFHDMGLIGNVLQPLYVGAQCVLMSPVSFLQRPVSWLEAISHYRATTSGGPNFAYELCVRKITPEQSEALDLSSWGVAFNGSEPINAETLSRFANTFERCGFRRQAFYPCYGLAEATLFVSGGQKLTGPVIRAVQRTDLERNQVAPTLARPEDVTNLVSCGKAWLEERIVIVDPESSTPCPPGRIGEIWVSGPSVAQGYWNQPEESERVFKAFLAGSGDGPFLRTGDLGFIEDDHLYVTGRIKELIIIRGRNHYPQDIERTVEKSHPALRQGAGAAFSVEVEGEERLVVVHEIERHYLHKNLEDVAGDIRQAVAEEHQLQVYAVVLSKPGSVPKTSSGKIQRHVCKADFLAGAMRAHKIDIVGFSDGDENTAGDDDPLDQEVPSLDSDQERQSSLERLLQRQIAQVLGIKSARLPVRQSLTKLGLDSLKAIEIQNRIETRWNVLLPMASLLRGVNIAQIASQIMADLSKPVAAPSSPSNLVRENSAGHPLSYGQHRLWFLDQLEAGDVSFNIFVALRLAGHLNLSTLEQAIGEIVARHEALRTTFSAVKGQPVQVINPRSTATLPVVDLRQLSQGRPTTKAMQLASEESLRPFDLGRGPLVRLTLMRLSDEEHILLLCMHHIIFDGWSVAILLRELVTLYEAYLSGAGFSLPELRPQYVEFARWQRQWLQGEVVQVQLDYWKRKFAAPLSRTGIPTDHPLPSKLTKRGACHWLKLSRERTERLKDLSKTEGCTLFMTLLAALKAMLHFYSGQNDIIVGTPIAGRNRAEFEKLIGFFLNTLALRTDVSRNLTFRELLGRVRDTALQAYANQDLPFERIVSEVIPDRSVNRSPLYQAWFVWQMAPIPTMALPQLVMSHIEMDLQATKFDLALNLAEGPDGVAGSFEYDRGLFEPTTIASLAGVFESVLDEAVKDPDFRLDFLKDKTIKIENPWMRWGRDYESTLHNKLKTVRRRILSDSVDPKLDDLA